MTVDTVPRRNIRRRVGSRQARILAAMASGRVMSTTAISDAIGNLYLPGDIESSLISLCERGQIEQVGAWQRGRNRQWRLSRDQEGD